MLQPGLWTWFCFHHFNRHSCVCVCVCMPVSLCVLYLCVSVCVCVLRVCLCVCVCGRGTVKCYPMYRFVSLSQPRHRTWLCPKAPVGLFCISAVLSFEDVV